MHNTAAIIKAASKVTFVRTLDGALWYTTDTGFEFPVPFEDTRGASFLAEDKPLYLMRWIRKQVDELNNPSDPIKALPEGVFDKIDNGFVTVTT